MAGKLRDGVKVSTCPGKFKIAWKVSKRPSNFPYGLENFTIAWRAAGVSKQFNPENTGLQKTSQVCKNFPDSIATFSNVIKNIAKTALLSKKGNILMMFWILEQFFLIKVCSLSHAMDKIRF